MVRQSEANWLRVELRAFEHVAVRQGHGERAEDMQVQRRTAIMQNGTRCTAENIPRSPFSCIFIFPAVSSRSQ